MELKLYLRILIKYWWLILATFVITLLPTLLLVNRQPWVYQAEATFVMRPRASIDVTNNDDVVRALDTLSRRIEINTTFAEVSSSSLIKQRAIERLDLSSQQRRGLRVNSNVVAGTNVLRITVQGPEPEVVRDFANAVSLETLAYVRNLYDVFELEPLDEAGLPDDPISPNKTLNLALGGAMGLFLGIGLVFLLEYLKEPIPAETEVNVIDPETGSFDKSYLLLRLRQELSRSGHNNYALSLALIKISRRDLVNGIAQPVPPAKALRMVVSALGPNMRDEDIIAHIGRSTFALLLPDIPGEAARDLLDFVRTQVGLVSPEIVGSDPESVFYSSIGIATYQSHDITADEILTQATNALEEADLAAYGRVNLFVHKVTNQVTPQAAANLAVNTP